MTQSVYKAICAVQSELSKIGITKDHHNKQQGYQFRGIDDCYNALSPLLAKNGLCILPRVLARTCTERQTAKGGTLFFVAVEVEFDGLVGACRHRATRDERGHEEGGGEEEAAAGAASGGRVGRGAVNRSGLGEETRGLVEVLGHVVLGSLGPGTKRLFRAGPIRLYEPSHGGAGWPAVSSVTRSLSSGPDGFAVCERSLRGTVTGVATVGMTRFSVRQGQVNPPQERPWTPTPNGKRRWSRGGRAGCPSVPADGLRVAPRPARGAVAPGDVVQAPGDLGGGVGAPVGGHGGHLRAGQ